MAEASGHDEKVEYLVISEIRMLLIEVLHLQGVDDSPDGVDDASCDQPYDGFARHAAGQFRKRKCCHPSHGYVDDRRYPLWKVPGEDGQKDPGKTDGPDKGKKLIAIRLWQGNDTDRGITSRYEKINAGMVKSLQVQGGARACAYCVKQGACKVESLHAPDEYSQGHSPVHGKAAH